MPIQMVRAAVLFGGPSAEHDISILTGLQTARLLAEAGTEVVALYWTKLGRWRTVPVGVEAAAFLEPEIGGSSEVQLQVPGGFAEQRRLRGSTPLEFDVLVNCCHGGPGEDGSLAALLRLAGYRVTGPSSEASALAMDKLATAAVAELAGVSSIPTAALSGDVPFAPPWVVKPRFGGSSVGVEVGVLDLDTARALAKRFGGPTGAVVQPYLDGWSDLNVAVRTHPTLQVSAIERPLRGDAQILDYRTKYLQGAGGMEATPRELPAQIPADVATRLVAAAEAFVTVAGITGLPRVDFLWDGGDELRFCELNSIPGALGLYLWEAAGQSRSTVLRDWIDEALGGAVLRPHWTGSSDGAALRSATTIAAKLMR